MGRLPDRNEPEEDEDDSVDEEAIDWDSQVLAPAEKMKLLATSDMMDMDDPFWQNKFIIRAVRAVNASLSLSATDSKPASVSESAFNRTEHLNEKTLAWHNELSVTDFENDAPQISNIIHPSKESLEVFRAQQEWLNNTNYQYENHAEACSRLSIINPDKPQIPGMRRSVRLKFWQVVVIAAAMDFETLQHYYHIYISPAVRLWRTPIPIHLYIYIYIYRAPRARMFN